MSTSECAAYEAGRDARNRGDFEDIFECEAHADDHYDGYDASAFIAGWEDAAGCNK